MPRRLVALLALGLTLILSPTFATTPDKVLSLLADFRFAEARDAATADAANSSPRARLARALTSLAAQPLTARQLIAGATALQAIAADVTVPPADRAAAAYFATRVAQWHDNRDPAAPDPAPLDAIATAYPDTFFGGLAALKAATARLQSAPTAADLLYWLNHYEQPAAFAPADPTLRRNLHLLLAEAAGRLPDDARATTHLATAYSLGSPHRTSAKLLLTRLVNLSARLGDTPAATRWLAEFERLFPHDVLLPQLRTALASAASSSS